MAVEKLDLLQTQLQAALSHLYDPLLEPGAELCRALSLPPDVAPDVGREQVRRALLQAIESLKPAVETPRTTDAYRVYQVLMLRYVSHLTQVQTAERLSITSRHLRREQRRAVRVLAAALAEQFDRGDGASASVSRSAENWQDQVRQEVAVLERQTPAATSDLGITLKGALTLARHVTEQRCLTVVSSSLPAGLTVPLHPSLLRQLLLVTLTSLAAQVAPGGRISVGGKDGPSSAHLWLTPVPLMPEADLLAGVMDRILPLTEASHVHAEWEEASGTLRLEVPLAQELRVLVIDDNDDLVHVFRRYANGTAFTIDHAKTEEGTFEAVATHRPAVIVLDIMLPETDGWELLVHLHAHPVTRDIPIIVCSVVRERDLALALGAQAYVPKPVRRREFIEALAAAVAPVRPESSQRPAPSGADSAA